MCQETLNPSAREKASRTNLARQTEQHRKLSSLLQNMSIAEACKEVQIHVRTARRIMDHFGWPHIDRPNTAVRVQERSVYEATERVPKRDTIKCLCGCGKTVEKKGTYTKQCYSDVCRIDAGLKPIQLTPLFNMGSHL